MSCAGTSNPYICFTQAQETDTSTLLPGFLDRPHPKVIDTVGWVCVEKSEGLQGLTEPFTNVVKMRDQLVPEGSWKFFSENKVSRCFRYGSSKEDGFARNVVDFHTMLEEWNLLQVALLRCGECTGWCRLTRTYGVDCLNCRQILCDNCATEWRICLAITCRAHVTDHECVQAVVSPKVRRHPFRNRE